jgi:hypothetical protein
MRLRFVSILGTIAMTVVAFAAAITPLVFPPQQLSRWVTSHVSTVRFSNLGFTDYDPATAYTAYFCETPAALVAVNAAMAVVRVDKRPRPSTCPLTLRDTLQKEPIFVGPNVEFTIAPWDNPVALVHDIAPSFYFASRTTLTRVRVVGTGLKSVTKVVGSQGEGACIDIVASRKGFSCALPKMPAGRIRPNSVVEFIVTTANGDTRFTIQALQDESVAIKSAVPRTLRSGSRFTLALKAPLSSTGELPWSPVFANIVSGEIEDRAVFTDIVWSPESLSVAATVTCPSCSAGLYTVSLGESIRGLAASIVSSDIIVTFEA